MAEHDLSFGEIVALVGTDVIVGSDRDGGFVHVFHSDREVWIEQEKTARGNMHAWVHASS